MKFCMWQTRMSETAMFCTRGGTHFKQFANVSILESWFLNCALWLSSWAFLEEISFSFIPLHFSIICHINVSIVTVFVPNMVLFIFNICSIQNILLTTVVLNHAHFQEQNPAETARLCFCLSAEWILYFYRVFYREEYFKREVFQRVVFIWHTVPCLKDTSMILSNMKHFAKLLGSNVNRQNQYRHTTDILVVICACSNSLLKAPAV